MISNKQTKIEPTNNINNIHSNTLTQKQQNSKEWDSRIKMGQVIFPQVWKAQEKKQTITKTIRLSCTYSIKRKFGSWAGIIKLSSI